MARWKSVLFWTVLGQKKPTQQEQELYSAKQFTLFYRFRFSNDRWKHVEYKWNRRRPSGKLIPKKVLRQPDLLWAMAMWIGDWISWCLPRWRQRIKQEPFSYKLKLGEFISNPSPIFQMACQSEDVGSSVLRIFQPGRGNLDLYIAVWKWGKVRGWKSLQFLIGFILAMQRWIQLYSQMPYLQSGENTSTICRPLTLIKMATWISSLERKYLSREIMRASP